MAAVGLEDAFIAQNLVSARLIGPGGPHLRGRVGGARGALEAIAEARLRPRRHQPTACHPSRARYRRVSLSGALEVARGLWAALGLVAPRSADLPTWVIDSVPRIVVVSRWGAYIPCLGVEFICYF